MPDVFLAHDSIVVRYGYVGESYRLGLAAPVRSGYAGDGDSEGCSSVLPYPRRHRFGDGCADRSLLLEDAFVYADLLFELIVVSDRAAGKDIRAARHFGQEMADEASGARFGNRQPPPALFENTQEVCSEGD